MYLLSELGKYLAPLRRANTNHKTLPAFGSNAAYFQCHVKNDTLKCIQNHIITLALRSRHAYILKNQKLEITATDASDILLAYAHHNRKM